MKKLFARAKALLLCIALASGLAQRGRAATAPSAITNYDSLRVVVTNGGMGGFGSNVTVSLPGTELEITNNLILDGGANTPTITGANLSRIFHVHTNGVLTLKNLAITGGRSTFGGAIDNEGTLIISNCLFFGNSATNASGAAGSNASGGGNDQGGNGRNGANAYGGAVYSSGFLQVSLSIFSNNTVTAGSGGNGGNGAADFVFGGKGGDGGNGGSAVGGAMVCAGASSLVLATEFVGNSCVAGSGGTGGSSAAAPFSGSGNGSSDGTGGSSLGGAVQASGPLRMTNCLFSANSVSAGAGGGSQSGGVAGGGGLELSGSTVSNYIENTTFFENSCTGGSGSFAAGGGLASATTFAQLRNCTLSDNILTAGSAAGWDLARVSGILKMGGSILSGGTTNTFIIITTNVTVTNITVTTNYSTNLNLIPPLVTTNFQTNIVTTTTPVSTTNSVSGTGTNCSGGITDLGYNISSDTSVAFAASTHSTNNEDPLLVTALVAPGSTVVGVPGSASAATLQTLSFSGGSPAIGVIPGIPGISFPATDGAFQLRGTPTSIGAYEANPISTSGSAPVVTLASSDTITNLGSTVVFAATAASANAAPLGYQWQLNGTNLADGANLSGAWTDTLTLTKLALTNAGSYSVLVGSSTLIGVTTSAVAVLTVISPVHITAQPKSLSVLAGLTATLSVTATGGPAPAYQWLKNKTILTDLPGKISGSTSNVLSINRATTNDAGTYSVLVTNASGPTNSTAAILTVAKDKTAPTVSISTPLASARTRSPVLNGTAADNVLVTNVLFWLTNLYTGSHTNGTATLTPGSGALVNWSILQALSPGTNTLAVQSQDFSGNPSAKFSRAFFYKVSAPLSLKSNGAGNGAFSATASAPGDALPADGASLNLGEGYSVTAMPDPFSVFNNWVASTGITSTNPTLKFIMTSNLILTANFAVATAGTYNGLFYNANAVSANPAGMLSGLTLARTGVYSGKLLIAGQSYTISGKFDASGHAATNAGPASAPGGPLRVQLLLTNQQILGTVSNTRGTASLLADFAGSTLPSAEYTALFSPPAGAPAGTPPGDGFALITNHAGAVTLSVTLADGAAFTQNVPATKAGNIPVYHSLYGNTGLLLGWINLTNLDAPPLPNALVWIKKPSPAPALYTNGFTNLLSLQTALWTNPPPRTPAISLTDGQLVISNTSLSLLFTNVSVNTSSALVKPAGAPTNSLTGSIAPKTGLLTLTFGNNNGKPKPTTAGSGAVLQSQTNAGGFFLTTTNAGTILLRP